MFEVVVIWFTVLISIILVVKRTEKPQTDMAKEVHNRAHRYG
jgi:hypothetical protein